MEMVLDGSDSRSKVWHLRTEERDQEQWERKNWKPISIRRIKVSRLNDKRKKNGFEDVAIRELKGGGKDRDCSFYKGRYNNKTGEIMSKAYKEERDM
jgi:hypothetical protein